MRSRPGLASHLSCRAILCTERPRDIRHSSSPNLIFKFVVSLVVELVLQRRQGCSVIEKFASCVHRLSRARVFCKDYLQARVTADAHMIDYDLGCCGD